MTNILFCIFTYTRNDHASFDLMHNVYSLGCMSSPTYITVCVSILYNWEVRRHFGCRCRPACVGHRPAHDTSCRAMARYTVLYVYVVCESKFYFLSSVIYFSYLFLTYVIAITVLHWRHQDFSLGDTHRSQFAETTVGAPEQNFASHSPSFRVPHSW